MLLTVCKKQDTGSVQQSTHGYLCFIMALFDLIFVIFILYLLYKLVFGLILPVSKAAGSVRDQMRNMQSGGSVNQPQNNTYHNPSANNSSSKKNTATAGDSEYIDFEEIK